LTEEGRVPQETDRDLLIVVSSNLANQPKKETGVGFPHGVMVEKPHIPQKDAVGFHIAGHHEILSGLRTLQTLFLPFFPACIYQFHITFTGGNLA